MTLSSQAQEEPHTSPPKRLQGIQSSTEHELLVALRKRNVYVDAAAHDMKQELTVILGVAQLLEREETAWTDMTLGGLATIRRSTRKLQRLVEEFLDLSRLESGQPVEFYAQPTDLVAVVRACVLECAQAPDHTLTLSTVAETIVGMWDATRLGRVIANLLTNAVKYSAPASAIYVALDVDRDADGQIAVLVVQDEGVGIPAADLPHIFTPYYRGSNVARTTVGTGIGLFGSRAIVEQMGGTLQLQSTAGAGTTATVRLPVGSVPISRPQAP